MIEVCLIERTRKFDIFVGQKKIGWVLVYDNGRACAYGEAVEGAEKFLETHNTLRQATNRVLRYDGFGDSKDVRVIRAEGGRKG